jgi:hypothetical protein
MKKQGISWDRGRKVRVLVVTVVTALTLLAAPAQAKGGSLSSTTPVVYETASFGGSWS